MKIAVIIGSTRPGRLGEQVGRWVFETVKGREDAEIELVDLADFDLPLLSEPTVPGAAGGQYEVPQTQRWADTITQYDGYVFVTPEYNHSVPAAFKNAFDVLGDEWRGKAVAFVGYGADGGVRAVEHWRQIVANLGMLALRDQVSLSLFTDADMSSGTFTPGKRRADEVTKVVDGLVGLAGMMRAQHGRV